MAGSLHEHKAAAEAEAAAYEAVVGGFPDGWGEAEEAAAEEAAAEEEYFGEEDGEGRLEEYTMVEPGLTPTLTLTLTPTLTLTLPLVPTLIPTLIPTLTLTRSSRTGPRRQERARGTG